MEWSIIHENIDDWSNHGTYVPTKHEIPPITTYFTVSVGNYESCHPHQPCDPGNFGFLVKLKMATEARKTVQEAPGENYVQADIKRRLDYLDIILLNEESGEYGDPPGWWEDLHLFHLELPNSDGDLTKSCNADSHCVTLANCTQSYRGASYGSELCLSNIQHNDNRWSALMFLKQSALDLLTLYLLNENMSAQVPRCAFTRLG